MIEKEILNTIIQSTDVTRLSESPLIREDDHLFTFSPFLDSEDYYIQKNNTYGYKIQDCFRETYPNNLENPLAVPFQNLISLHCFKKTSDINIIKNFINNYLVSTKGFDKEKIYIILPEIEEIKAIFKEVRKNKIFISQERLSCKLPLPGKHYYVKIVYHYLDGLISIANFVLVDFKYQKFQLDSVIFPERINMIHESKKYIYSQEKYQEIVTTLSRIGIKNANHHHFFIGNLIAAIKLLSQTREISSKKQGYTVKKLLKEVYIESNINTFLLGSNLENIITNIEKYLGIPEENSVKNLIVINFNEFSSNYLKQTRKVEKKLVSMKVIEEIDVNNLHSTYGIDKRIILAMAKKMGIKTFYEEDKKTPFFAYHFNSNENNYKNPLKDYI